MFKQTTHARTHLSKKNVCKTYFFRFFLKKLTINNKDLPIKRKTKNVRNNILSRKISNNNVH